jgi:hypothetical protein
MDFPKVKTLTIDLLALKIVHFPFSLVEWRGNILLNIKVKIHFWFLHGSIEPIESNNIKTLREVLSTVKLARGQILFRDFYCS